MTEKMGTDHGSSSVSKEVAQIARQAEQTFKDKGYRWDTYFYKVVLAGNVKVIKQVVAHMNNQGSAETLDWLFKREEFEERRYLNEKMSKRVLLIRILLFVMMTVVNILVTPVCYALHGLTTSFLNRKQRRISAQIKLPLAYAAFSQNKEMVTFFLSQGVELEHIDRHGNNIFHYISDLSSVASDTAIRIFSSMVTEINDRDSVKQLLEHDRNSAGLTAVEYAAKFGSPSLLTQILNQPDIMHHTTFSASADHVRINEEVALIDTHASSKVSSPSDDTTQPEQHDASTRVELVDVSPYEAGQLVHQSTLLNILSDRDVASMSRIDLQIFSDARFTGKWLILKCKQMIPGVAFFHLLDVAVTVLLVYLLGTSFSGETGVHSVVWSWKGYRDVHLTQLQHIATGTSSILKDDVFHARVNKTSLALQVDWIVILWREDTEEARHLLKASALDHILLQLESSGSSYQLNANVTSSDLDKLYEQVLTMSDSNMTEALLVSRHLPQVLTEFARQLLERKRDFFQGSENIATNRQNIDDIFYEEFTVNVNDKLIRPKPYIPIGYILSLVCQHISHYSANDFLLQHPRISYREMIEEGVESTCDYQQFVHATVHVNEKTCKNSDDRIVLHFMFAPFNKASDIYKAHKTLTKLIMHVVIVSTYLYIILDVFERCVFLSNSVVQQTSPRDMVVTALGQKVPGSYVRKQLNVLSAISIIAYFHCEHYIRQARIDGSLGHREFYSYLSLVTMVIIVAIVVRFLMHIHSLRLLPGIGHFVITTFMMGTNLMHFSAVFGIVLLIFSMLFHILIDDPSCPLEKEEGFVTLQDSLLSAFRLAFAHGNLNPFFTTAPVQLTYVLYVIIVGLLLLNLIIAIMSSTATAIMADPWREVLWRVEWLDEATSAEYTLSVLTLPFRKHRVYWFHKKAGFIVKKTPDNKHRIYIECFRCPALLVQEGED